MIKARTNLSEDELKTLRAVAQHSGRSLADLVHEVVWQVWRRPGPASTGPMALYDEIPSRSFVEHDVIYDECRTLPAAS